MATGGGFWVAIGDPNVDKEKLKKLIEKSRKIADEKNFKGGQYRIHYLSVARSVKP